MTLRCALLTVLLLSAGLGGLAVGEGEPGEHYLNATFTTTSGRAIRDLEPGEIVVSLGPNELEVTRVIGPEEPFDIGLVLDVSPSTEQDLDLIRQATADFVDYFPLESRIMVLTFDDEVYVDCDWTTDRKKVDEAIWEFGLHKPGSSTILYEAVVMALEQKFLDRRPRAAMILYTDGVDTASKAVKERDTFDFVAGLGVVPYVIQFFDYDHYWKLHAPSYAGRDPQGRRYPRGPTSYPGGGTPGQTGGIMVGGSEWDYARYKIETTHKNASAYLQRFAQSADGYFAPVVGLDELPRAYEKIAVELLDVYTIYFKAPGPPPQGFRRVSVSTTRPDVIVKARPSGFWAK